MASNKKSPRNLPLEVKVVRGILTISIGVDTLKWAAEHNEEFWQPTIDKYAMVVIDADELADDVSYALQDEAEDGTTPVHTLLDKAILQAMENGCAGFDFDAMEVIEAEEKQASGGGEP